jgi:lysyl-tRNA synthetase class I
MIKTLIKNFKKAVIEKSEEIKKLNEIMNKKGEEMEQLRKEKSEEINSLRKKVEDFIKIINNKKEMNEIYEVLKETSILNSFFYLSYLFIFLSLLLFSPKYWVL